MISQLVIMLVLFIVTAFSISSIIVLIPDYKYYSKTYKLLPTITSWYRFKDQIWENSNGNGITWFLDCNSILLSEGHYLHNSLITYFNPYSLYWLFKYKRYFKKHLSSLKPAQRF